MNYWKLGCRWYTKAPLFYKYLLENKIVISWSDKKYNINDKVLLTDGHTSLGIAIVKSEPTSIINLLKHVDSFNLFNIPTTDKNLLIFDADIFSIDQQKQFSYKLQSGIRRVQKKSIKEAMTDLVNNNLKNQSMNDIVNLLQYKKQIILQGPPGAGKTKLAKELAERFIKGNTIKVSEKNIRVNDLIAIFKINDILISSNNKTSYKVIAKDDNSIKLESETRKDIDTVTFETLLKCIENPNDFPLGTGLNSQYIAAANYAKDKSKTLNANEESENNQFKLIQFHPSYTYEDFVRGIVAESKDEKIEYKNVNKTLGLFAEQAFKNFENSKKVPEVMSKEIWIQEQYLIFKEYLESELEKSGELLIKNDTKPKITAIENDAIRVNRYSNEDDSVLIKDNDIIYGYIGLHFSETIVKVKDNSALSKSARSGMYYLYQNLIEKFSEYLEKEGLSYHPTENAKSEELKNYVLIIDEINRANLSSVLGELIYALEYRGEEVESMYEVDDSQKLVLPPNLYIIGTINTADRSVGHIDYAIRRRFAFVDVLPKELDDDKIVFHKDWFKKVSELFIINYDEYVSNEKTPLKRAKTLSAEFRPEDVWIGHSYFIQKKLEDGSLEPDDFRIRIDYEIKPILLEYAKDGVLTGKVGEITVEDYIKSL